MVPHRAFTFLITTLLTACEKSASGGGVACGLAALAGPTALLNQFGVPRRTLGVAPTRLPERLVTRLAAGPSYPAVVGRADSAWIIGVEGALPKDAKASFGVLVVDPAERARGVVLFQGMPVEGAPQIGLVSVADAIIPLLGVQVDPAQLEDPRCPMFPDSVLQ